MRRSIVVTGLVFIAGTVGLAIEQPMFRAAVDGVRIDVSVMNGLSPVAGLTADQFAVLDNGVPQTVESVSLDNVPLSLTLVLDTSGSMLGERMRDLIDAARTLVTGLREEDAAALITFSEAVHFPVAMTRDRSAILAALDGLVAAGQTTLNDAAFLGLQMRPTEAGDTRQVMLLFSDGQDSTSWLNARQLIEAARRSRMLTHVVELHGSQPGGPFMPFDVLGELASAGGGRRWSGHSSRGLRELFGKVLSELRSRYMLTYTPRGVTREGWHDVKVTLKGVRGDVTARPGYFVGAQ